jgi:hypothetical protein
VWPNVVYVGLGLSLISDAPFFASYLMPDLFTGIAILGSAVLFACGKHIRWPQLGLWFLLISAALLFHDSNILIVAVLTMISLSICLVTRSTKNLRSLAIVGLAVLVAFVGQAIFSAMVKRTTGAPPLRPPFFSAHLIETNFAATYLRETCPGNGFAICQFAGQFPADSQQFLWGKSKEDGGIFFVVPPEAQRKISAEDKRFAIAVFKYSPWSFTGDTIEKAAQQLISLRLDDFRCSKGLRSELDATLPIQTLDALHSSAAYRQTMPINLFTVVNYCGVILSVAYLICTLALGWPRELMDKRVRTLANWVFMGVILNATVCGGISQVLSRYGARAIWVLPLLVLLIESQALHNHGLVIHAGEEGSTPKILT